MSNLFTSIYNSLIARLQRLLLTILSHGPIPKHVAFVMDGNRRYARKMGMRVEKGHGEGFESLKRTLELCLHVRIPTITLFAFSIDNFTRPPSEISTIMSLAESNLVELAKEGELLSEWEVRVNVLGRRELLDKGVRDAVERVEEMTRGNGRSVLNVCCPYTSRDEISTAVSTVASSVRRGELDESGITEEEIYSHLSTEKVHSPPLDILVRTSDVRRLSDFMLWQCNKSTQLQFVETFWPEFGIKDMLPILLQYQQKIWLGRL